jgi:excisionase family DNA binding protein
LITYLLLEITFEREAIKMDELLRNYPAALSISDVAEILNITPATVRRHIKSNDLPHIKVGRLVRIPKDSLIRYLHGDPTPQRKEGTA